MLCKTPIHYMRDHSNKRDTIFWSTEGKHRKDKRDAYVKSHRAETRFDCLRKMKIDYCRGTNTDNVVTFIPHHKHVTSKSI